MRTRRQKLEYLNHILTLPDGRTFFVSWAQILHTKDYADFRVLITDARHKPAKRLVLRAPESLAFYREYDSVKGKPLTDNVRLLRRIARLQREYAMLREESTS